MLKRLLLAHILLVTFAVPVVVFAEEPEPTPENPPVLIVREGSLCNYETLGVSEDGSGVLLRAIWIPKEYSVPEGKYLAVTAESADIVDCPKDSYCPGLPSYTFNGNDSDQDRGRYLCESGYHTDSIANISAMACYKTETVSCSNKNPYTTEHMTSVIYSSADTICTQRQGEEAHCDSSCDVVGLVCEEGYQARKVDNVWTCVGNIVNCEAGKYLSIAAQECKLCPENHFCGGGEYSLTETEDQGISSCKGNLKSPEGATSEKDCGIIFRIGGEALYMHSDRRDTDHPALVIQDSKGTKWYAPMNKVGEGRIDAKPVNDSGTTKQLHVMFNGEEYTVHTSLYEE